MVKRGLVAILFFDVLMLAVYDLYAANTNVSRRMVSNSLVRSGDRLTVYDNGKTSKSQINGGMEYVMPGGLSFSARVSQKGKLWITGGKAYNAIVTGGSLMVVCPHKCGERGYAANTRLADSRMNVFNNALAENITVGNGGLLRVYFKDSLVSDVTVLAGGVLHVWRNGTARNVYVAPGGLLDLREQSPILKDEIRVAGQLKVSFNNTPDVRNANIILDLSKRRPGDDYCIINLDYLKNEKISLNVTEDQPEGSYKLASGALRWKKSFGLTVGDRPARQLAIGRPVNLSGKYYILTKVDKNLELKISRTPPSNADLAVEIEVSPEQKEILKKSFGFDIVAQNYSVSASGKKLTQQDLDADVQVIIDQFRFLGEKCVRMSRNPKIIIRGIGSTSQSAGALHFQHRSTGAIRHEFNHSFEPYGLAYRFWKGLNNKNAFYVGGSWKNSRYGLSFREKLNCASNQSEFRDDFMGSYGQTTIHEDITMIFGCATSPKSSFKCTERSRRNPVFRKKLYYLIASYLEVTTEEFWTKLLDLTEEEKREIRACRIDIEKERNVKVHYTKDQPYRYSFQNLSVMGLLELSPAMIEASGLKNIKFFKDNRNLQINGDTLTYFERSRSGHDLAKGIFLACYRRHPQRVRTYLHNRLSEDEWAKLFARCTFKGIRSVAKQSSQSDKEYQNVLCLRRFTEAWLPDSYWEEFDWLYAEFCKDNEYQKSFAQYGIDFSSPLPASIQGESCTKEEIEQAKHVFIVCSSALTREFFQKCKIKKVAIAKNMKLNGKRVRGGAAYVDGILCLDPTNKKLAKPVFKFLYLAYEDGESTSGFTRNDLAQTFADLMWNSFDTYQRMQKSERLRQKVKYIFDRKIFRNDIYETMNLKRFGM